MSNPLMGKMLDLPEFEVTDFKQNDNDMGFYVQDCRKEKPVACTTGAARKEVWETAKPCRRYYNTAALVWQTERGALNEREKS